jgi:hypothetical protein
LERAWQQHLMNNKRTPAQFASNTQDDGKTVVRLTAPPVQPLDTRPNLIVRGQSPEGDTSGGWNNQPRSTYEARPTSLSGSFPPPPPTPQGAIFLGTPQPYQPPPPSVQLGTPTQAPVFVQGYPH